MKRTHMTVSKIIILFIMCTLFTIGYGVCEYYNQHTWSIVMEIMSEVMLGFTLFYCTKLPQIKRWRLKRRDDANKPQN